jgi:hypothetical protein
MTGSAPSLSKNRLLRRLLALVVTPVALVVLSAAPASAAVMVTTPGTAELTNRVLITVPVSVVCDPLPNSPYLDYVQVAIVQASGREVNRGSGWLSDTTLFTCDGSTVNDVAVQAFPDPGSGPFQGGPAIATIWATHITAESCGPGCSWNQQYDSASLGPMTIHLRG